ncbi:MAG: hypothetical protein OHK93_004709 [Ramalina farinacea]|uniref:Uncharacterized protein n=1 Tax=Ramalina farinacea TaxID=258253 RepID=A0AA43QX23_9LECA|nr:hypothetical protein [Ramalina farinacea]
MVRADSLAIRYLFKWRLIVIKAKHSEYDRINNEGAQDSEHAQSCEEVNKAPTTLQQPESVSSGVGSPQSPPVPASIEPTGLLDRPNTPAPESPSSKDPLQALSTELPEIPSESESLSLPPPGGIIPLPSSLDDAPEPAYAQSRSSDWRDKRNEGLAKFQKAPRGKPALPTWLANELAQEGLADQQDIPTQSSPSPNPKKWLPKSPRVPKEEQSWGEDDANAFPASRLADMLYGAEGPVKVVKCAHDKDCAVQILTSTAHYITDSLSTFPDHYESSPTCELQRHILDVSRIFETRGVADDTRSTSVSLPPSSDTKNTAVIIAGSSAARLKATDGKKEIFETTSIKFQRIPACRKSVLWPRLRLLKVITSVVPSPPTPEALSLATPPPSSAAPSEGDPEPERLSSPQIKALKSLSSTSSPCQTPLITPPPRSEFQVLGISPVSSPSLSFPHGLPNDQQLPPNPKPTTTDRELQAPAKLITGAKERPHHESSGIGQDKQAPSLQNNGESDVSSHPAQVPDSMDGPNVSKQPMPRSKEPTSTFTQPKPPPPRPKPGKDKRCGEKISRPRPAVPAFLLPKTGKQRRPTRDAPPSPPSRLSSMVIATDNPVVTQLCERDKSCSFQVCGKAHHGPLVDPSKPFKIRDWCKFDHCTSRNCGKLRALPPVSRASEQVGLQAHRLGKRQNTSDKVGIKVIEV